MNEYEKRGRWAVIDENIESLWHRSLSRSSKYCPSHDKPRKAEFAEKARELVQLIESLPEDQ